MLSKILKSVHPDWMVYFNAEGGKIIKLLEEILQELSKIPNKQPLPEKILKCFDIPPKDLKAVIINSQIYTEPGYATGYALGCENQPYQPSLNLLVRDLAIHTGDLSLGVETLFDYTLKSWRDQGIMLLNIGLTGESFGLAHIEIWDKFHQEIFKIMNDLKLTEKNFQSLYFVFLGSIPKKYETLINENFHYKIFERNLLENGKPLSFFEKITDIVWT